MQRSTTITTFFVARQGYTHLPGVHQPKRAVVREAKDDHESLKRGQLLFIGALKYLEDACSLPQREPFPLQTFQNPAPAGFETMSRYTTVLPRQLDSLRLDNT